MNTLRWIFDPARPSGARYGGLATAHIIRPDLDNFVREVLQNARDQRAGNQLVRVRFTFYQLSGEAKDSFLEGVGWDELEPHIYGAAKEGGITIGPQLSHALQVIQSEPLTILRIDDSGTRGLTGGEDDDTENFNLLCRHVLVTSEGAATRGGSFGIGKSVLWRFSRLSTVLFSSRIAPDRFRFFGRAELPYHSTNEGKWDGAGWYGHEQRVAQGRRAVSVWGRTAEEVARQLYLFRPVQLGIGTTILIVAFFEPKREEPRDLQELARDILASAARWFWPSLDPASPTLQVIVQAFQNGTQLYHQEAEIGEEVKPFLLAKSATNPLERVSNSGDVAQRIFTFRIPARRARGSDKGHPEMDAQLTLRLRAAGSQDSPEHRNTVALMRGAGMVVSYRPFRLPASEQPYHAVLYAGLARGTLDADRAMEQFLRAAEPPGHDDWTAGTDRLQAEYRPGAAGRLNQLWKDVDRAIMELCEEQPPETAEGPRKLAELFPLSGRGRPSPPREKFRVDRLHAQYQDGVWRVSGVVRCLAADGRRWSFAVSVWLDAETGPGETIAVANLRVDRGTTRRSGDRWECDVPAGVPEVQFSGETEPAPQGVTLTDLRRTRIRLEVRGRMASDR